MKFSHKKRVVFHRYIIAWLSLLLVAFTATPSESAGILFSRSVWRDITQRKEMEEALKKAHDDLERKVEERTAQLSKTVDKLSETELRYRTVADFTYDWEFWANMDGTLRYVSPSCERISGYTVEQFMENPSLFREIIITEDQDIWDKHYHDSRKELKEREIQFRIRSRDGAVRWIEHACQPVSGDQGGMLGFRASNRDITTRKEGDTLQLADTLEAYLPEDLASPDLPIKSLAEIEQEHILRVLKNTNWKIHGESGAADLLDINPSTLRGRMRKHGIQHPPYKI